MAVGALPRRGQAVLKRIAAGSNLNGVALQGAVESLERNDIGDVNPSPVFK